MVNFVYLVCIPCPQNEDEWMKFCIKNITPLSYWLLEKTVWILLLGKTYQNKIVPLGYKLSYLTQGG